MAKKLRFYRVLSCTIALLTTITLIIACGSGDPVDVEAFAGKIEESESRIISNVSSIVEKRSSSSDVDDATSSSGGDQSSNSEVGSSSSGGGQSSSSGKGEEQSSSSSSSEPSSSSESSKYTFTCKIPENSTFPASVKIPDENRPELKCKDKDDKDIPLEFEDIGTWTDAPNWRTPKAGEYDHIKAKVGPDAKGCKGLEAECEGKITITGGSNPPPPSSSSAGGSEQSSSSATQSSSSAAASSSSIASSSSAAPSNEQECKDSSGKQQYCEYQPWNGSLGGCYALDARYSDPKTTCDAARKHCTDNSGTIYVDVPASQVGDGKKCTIGSSSSTGGGNSSSSGDDGGSAGCNAGATVITGCSSANTTSAVCFKKAGDINGWNASNASGRTCTPSGGSEVSPGADGAIGNQPKINATSDGNAYINCTAGSLSYFGVSCW